MNLRDRLAHIKTLRPGAPQKGGGRCGGEPPAEGGSGEAELRSGGGNFPPPEWVPAGHETLKRTLVIEPPLGLPDVFPPALGIVAPDLACMLGGVRAGPGELLFFDLETTGLSGGAGTLAFLAAFGRLERAGEGYRLRVTQYLLLDYPGEGDFIGALLAEMGEGPLLTTYNGKTFDAQIFRNRCLMNGFFPPAFRHLDLLHPCRRLWKRVLPDCSQGTIETAVLGLDRTGDIPGALAPEIWFGFLKTGDFSGLQGIADHNRRDIEGLARILAALTAIAASPLETLDVYRPDPEALALRWRDALRSTDLVLPVGLERTGELLLETAVVRGYPRAAYIRGLDLLRSSREAEGRALLEALAEGKGFTTARPELRALACRKLAIDAERRLRDPVLALAHTDAALAILDGEGGQGLRRELERRRDRLGTEEQGLGTGTSLADINNANAKEAV